MSDLAPVNIETVDEIFEKSLVIPAYQRPYKWQTKHIKQLVDDIRSYFEQVQDGRTDGNAKCRLGTIVLHKNKIYAVSGGTSSRLFIGNKSRQLPMMQGTATSGANAIAINNNIIAIAGGDFTKTDRTDSIFIISTNKGKSWYRPDSPLSFR